jgi:NTE family protein
MKALVLSGGGSKGAFQVGAMKRLIKFEQNSYDIFCGTSVGALNSTYMSQFSHENQQEGITDLINLWSNIAQNDVYTSWPILGPILGIFKKGLYNASPLKNLIKKNINTKRIATQLRLATVSLSTGSLRVFTEEDNNILEAVYASAAYPVMFEPIKIGEEWYTDGGLRDLTPLKQAIEAGADEIHIINCSSTLMNNQEVDSLKSFGILLRSIEIMTNEILLNDLQTMSTINKEVQAGTNTEKKYIKFKLLQPSLYTKLSDPLKFNKQEILDMIEAGQWDTSEYITDQTEFSFN